MKKAFTLIELVVAVALLAMALAFSGIIFKVSIESYRTAVANAEIMQKLRAITDQLNADFQGLQKDGYLILDSAGITRKEFRDSPASGGFRADRLYYFATGDFQSWFNQDIRSNIARIYFGHERYSLADANNIVSGWNLARDVILLTPGNSDPNFDYRNISYTQCKSDLGSFEDPNILLSNPVAINPLVNIQSLLCQNAGEVRIEWTDGTKDPNGILNWFGLSRPRGISIENTTNWPYRVFWTPTTPGQLWPEAMKFTFTLYDSRRILKEGRTFTHIVYLDNKP